VRKESGERNAAVLETAIQLRPRLARYQPPTTSGVNSYHPSLSRFLSLSLSLSVARRHCAASNASANAASRYRLYYYCDDRRFDHYDRRRIRCLLNSIARSLVTSTRPLCPVNAARYCYRISYSTRSCLPNARDLSFLIVVAISESFGVISRSFLVPE
ncbi:hypothetical protein WH47_09123, partial [Habropoda laboriosa]